MTATDPTSTAQDRVADMSTDGTELGVALGWTRIESGWYRTEVDGVRYEIINMQGEAVRYTGAGAHWLIYQGGEGDLGHGRSQIGSAFTLADAKKTLSARLTKRYVPQEGDYGKAVSGATYFFHDGMWEGGFTEERREERVSHEDAVRNGWTFTRAVSS